MARRRVFAALAAAGCGLAAPLSAAMAADAGASFNVDGVVPTVCRVQLASTAIVSGHTVDLGSMTELCNDGKGYKVVLNTPAGSGGQVVIDNAPPIPIAANGHTLIVDSNTDAFRHRTLKLELAVGSPVFTHVSFTTSPKGAIF